MSEGTHTSDLRERKRLASMRRIQDIALDLFESEGYGTVTIERIAAAADVSPSSVYRYFGTKEQIVLWDEYDPVWIGELLDEISAQPPMDALRRAVEVLIIGPLTTDEAYVRAAHPAHHGGAVDRGGVRPSPCTRRPSASARPSARRWAANTGTSRSSCSRTPWSARSPARSTTGTRADS